MHATGDSTTHGNRHQDTIRRSSSARSTSTISATTSSTSSRPARDSTRKIVAEISEMKNEPAWMREFRLKSLEIFNSKPMPQLGRQDRHQLPGHLLLPQADRPARASPGTTCPTEIKNTFDKLGIPEAEKKFLAGVKAQYESEVVYGSLREDLSQAGRDLHRHRLGRPRASRPGARVLRHDHSAHRQQVRRAELGRLVGRVVHLRAAGREDRVPLAGLFPHQRGQHGPVRADADHRRRRAPRCITSKAAPPRCTAPKACTRPWSR